jgi:hypothetical protein
VGIDLTRVAAAALEAAITPQEILEPEKNKKKKHHPVRMIIVGGTLVAVARAGQKHMPKMAKVPMKMGLDKLEDMASMDRFTDALRERFGSEHRPDESQDLEPQDDYDDDDYYDEPEDDEPEGDEPEDEAEPGDDVDDDEPRDKAGAQRAADAAPANGRAEAPGVMDALSHTPRRRRRTRRSSTVDPAE